MRKFSVPYSASIDAESYIQLLDEYNPFIESVYFGIPELNNHVSLQKKSTKKENLIPFIEQSMGKVKRFVVYNGISYNKNDFYVFKLFDRVINPLIEKYSIDGFIISSLSLARKLRQDFPSMELHTSCNTFLWNVRQMELWRDLAGINVFNPPREAAKSPSMLKDMFDAGFKLKVIVNEACTYGCPYTINHACMVAEEKLVDIECYNGDPSQVMRTNFYSPSWLEYIDKYVYCYKLSGRGYPLKFLKTIFDAYIKQDSFDYYIDELATFGGMNVVKSLKDNGVRVKISDIPDKTRYCEAKECSQCTVCSNAVRSIMNR